jgi:hypothetical protein
MLVDVTGRAPAANPTVNSSSPARSTSLVGAAEAVVTVPAVLSMKKVKPVKVALLAPNACSTLGSNSITTSVEPTVNAALVVTSTTPSPEIGIKPELTSSVVTESQVVGVAVGVGVGVGGPASESPTHTSSMNVSPT